MSIFDVFDLVLSICLVLLFIFLLVDIKNDIKEHLKEQKEREELQAKADAIKEERRKNSIFNKDKET